jgi:hypothetical protein
MSNAGYPQLRPEQHLAFAIRVNRAEFQSQPSKLQAETLARVQETIKRHPDSYLAKHAAEIYGVGSTPKKGRTFDDNDW